MAIITQLQGGLGNQLFQYATARALALRKHQALVLDDQWYAQSYEQVTPRQVQLQALSIVGQIHTYAPIKAPKRIQKILQSTLPISPFVLKEKKDKIYDPRIEHAPAFANQDLYLMGYWQSYKYFASIRMHLLQETKAKEPIDTHYQKYLEQIEHSPNAVMVHIRRGDYVHLPVVAQVHGALPITYYAQAMERMMARCPDASFFVFSDDLAWAKDHLPFQDQIQNKIIFIENAPIEHAVVGELALMRSCQHHILANSSLSWWGAWLCENPQQQVICPSQWMSDHRLPLDDLLPTSWQQI